MRCECDGRLTLGIYLRLFYCRCGYPLIHSVLLTSIWLCCELNRRISVFLFVSPSSHLPILHCSCSLVRLAVVLRAHFYWFLEWDALHDMIRLTLRCFHISPNQNMWRVQFLAFAQQISPSNNAEAVETISQSTFPSICGIRIWKSVEVKTITYHLFARAQAFEFVSKLQNNSSFVVQRNWNKIKKNPKTTLLTYIGSNQYFISSIIPIKTEFFSLNNLFTTNQHSIDGWFLMIDLNIRNS